MIEEKVIKYPNLLAEMARCGETYTSIAEVVGMSVSAVQRRFSGAVEWSKSEIDTICDHFNKDYDYLFRQR
jgi:hypothetical protein